MFSAVGNHSGSSVSIGCQAKTEGWWLREVFLSMRVREDWLGILGISDAYLGSTFATGVTSVWMSSNLVDTLVPLLWELTG